VSISHDWYMFDSDEFAQTLGREQLLLNDYPHSYSTLRTRGLDLFQRSEQTRTLADRYGGWDYASIVSEFSNEPERLLDGYCFWYSLFLYSLLERLPVPSPFLSDVDWENVDSILQFEGWTELERDALVIGARLDTLALQWLPNLPFTSDAKERCVVIWQRLRPFSTSSNAGWVPISAIPALISRLEEIEDRESSQVPNGDTFILNQIERIMGILRIAFSRKKSLCILISG
jgi:hypothetical protein